VHSSISIFLEIERTRLFILRRRQLPHVYLDRGVLDGHAYQIASRVQVDVEVFIDLAGFRHRMIEKLHPDRIGILEILRV